MNLSQLMQLTQRPLPWESGDKIPWNEVEFSQRMLSSHLSQDHDWASRRATSIEQQLNWIVPRIPVDGRVLDLGCGPGLYTQRLAEQGFKCVGVDFSPASIAYAERQATEHRFDIHYHLQDLRTFDTAERFDLIMMTFGEFNVFRREEMVSVLRNVHRWLNPAGQFIVEVHQYDEVQRQGLAGTSWDRAESGLFSIRPHVRLQENFWYQAESAAVTRYLIVDLESTNLTEYGATMQAYTDQQYGNLLRQAGLMRVNQVDEWPTGDIFANKLTAYLASKD